VPENADHTELVPDWHIQLSGVPLSEELVSNVLSIEVEQHVDGADSFDIEVSAFDLDTQEFSSLDNASFEEGSEVSIKAGYGEHIERLILGEVVALQVEYDPENAPSLHVQGYDKLHRFRRGRRTRTFANSSDAEIAEQVAQHLGIGSEVEDTGIVHDHVIQYNQSDIDFLQERARRIHFEVDVEDGILHFRPARHDRGEATTYRYGEDLKRLSLRASTLSQVNQVVVRGWNIGSKEAIVGVGSAGDERVQMGDGSLGATIASSAFGDDFHEVIVDRAVFDQNEADQIAKGIFDKLSLRFIQAEGECIGSSALRAGDTMRIEGIGTRFSGLYYLTKVHHILDSEGFRTRINCLRNATS
jgi:phage protein D